MAAVSYSTKTPSKFLSLAFLKACRENYYKSEGGIEYDPQEVDLLIADKEEKEALKALKEEEAYWIELSDADEEEDNMIPFPTDADYCEADADAIIPVEIIEEVEKQLAKKENTDAKRFGKKIFEAKRFAAKATRDRSVDTGAGERGSRNGDSAGHGDNQGICRGGNGADANGQGSITHIEILLSGGKLMAKLRRRPGPKPGEKGTKERVTIALDPDLVKMAEASGNKSKFINGVLRRFIDTIAL